MWYSINYSPWTQSSAHTLLWASILAFLNTALFPSVFWMGYPRQGAARQNIWDQEAMCYALKLPSCLFLRQQAITNVFCWGHCTTSQGNTPVAALPSASHCWLETSPRCCLHSLAHSPSPLLAGVHGLIVNLSSITMHTPESRTNVEEGASNHEHICGFFTTWELSSAEKTTALGTVGPGAQDVLCLFSS